jgi:hypothetical protein
MTDYLFARPSFWEGVARNFDIYGGLNRYNYSKTGAEADRLALMSDWKAVYNDLWQAYNDTICQIEAKKADA